MRLVVADTGPVNYLILIGRIDLLPALFETVILPSSVHNELTAFKTPSAVREWIAKPQPWLEVREAPTGESSDAFLDRLDPGEKEAIRLATFLQADLLLMDNRKGVIAAKRRGLRVTGTLGVLDLAAARGLVDFAQAVKDLERTNFRRPLELLDALLKRHDQSLK